MENLNYYQAHDILISGEFQYAKMGDIIIFYKEDGFYQLKGKKEIRFFVDNHSLNSKDWEVYNEK